MNDWLKNLKIRHALIFTIAISLLTLSSAGILLGNSAFKEVFRSNIEKDLLPNQLDKIEAKIRHQLSTPLELSKAVTQNKFLIDWVQSGEPVAQQAEVIDFLDYMQEKNSALVVFWVSNITQNYYTQSGITRTVNRQDDQWFYSFLDSGKPFEVSFDIDKKLNKLTAFINYKVTSNGQDIAVAGLGYPVDEISTDILTNKVGESGYVFVTNSSGDVIIHRDLSTLKQGKLQNFDGFEQVSSKLLNPSPSYVFDVVHYQGEDYYVASVGLPELDWKIIAMLPKAEPMSHVNSVLLNTALLNLLIAAGFIFLMIVVAKRITRPIVEIGDKMLKMAEYGGDLTQKLDEERGDEIGRLAQGFNAILAKIRMIMVDIQQTQNMMSSSFDRLRDMSAQVDSYVSQQQMESDSVATATTEMNQSIQEVSELASNTAGKTEFSEQQIINTSQQVDETSHVMIRLHESNADTQDKIQVLAEQTQTISTVVDTISGISDQTNLLALNAAIEAARAGEQGRGFAVVADEVRSLAARTQSSTSEIKDVIEKLQQQSVQTVSAMALNTELASDGLEKTNVAKEALASVVQEISLITEMNVQVATATNEQSNVIGELSVNVTKISDMASQVSALSQQTTSIIGELDAQKAHLGDLVAQFKTE
jgi:methyl-accepting chemotaxis protein